MAIIHSGNAILQFFEREQYVGEKLVYCHGATLAGEPFSAAFPNLAFFCPECGSLWGRAIYQFQFHYSPRVRLLWAVVQRLCTECGDGSFSFKDSIADERLEHWSPELLRRELLVLIERK